MRPPDVCPDLLERKYADAPPRPTRIADAIPYFTNLLLVIFFIPISVRKMERGEHP